MRWKGNLGSTDFADIGRFANFAGMCWRGRETGGKARNIDCMFFMS